MLSVFNTFFRFSVLWFVLTFLTSCGLRSPQAPRWDLDLQIPLINKTYLSGELLDKLSSQNIETDSNGVSWFCLDKSLDSLRLDQILEIGDISLHSEEEVGRIRISTPEAENLQLAMADHLPLIAGFVPDTGLLVDLPIAQPSTFQEATFEDAEFALRVTNNTGFELDSLNWTLNDMGRGQVVFNETVPRGLSIGGTHYSTLPLGGKTLSDDLSLSVYFHTLGGSAISLAGREISLNLGFSDTIYVISAVAAIERFESRHSEAVHLSTNHQIESAALGHGWLSLQIQNHLPLATSFQVTLPEVTSGGFPLTFDLIADSGAIGERQIDLSGYHLSPNDNQIGAEINAVISSSYGQQVTVHSSDRLSFDFLWADIEVSSAEAVIAPTEISWKEESLQVEIPEGLQNASLTKAELVVEIENASTLAGEAEVTLQSPQGEMITLSGPVASGSRTVPSVSQFHSDQLQRFLSPVPASFSVAGTASIGDGHTIVNISEEDFLAAKIRISSPLVFQLDSSMIESDARRQEIDEDIRDHVERIAHGTVSSTITNHLPLGAAITLYFSTDSADLYGEPAFTIGPFACDRAEVGSNGWATGVRATNNVVELNSSEIEIFSNPVVFVGSIITIPGTGGAFVEIRAEDFLQVLSSLQISARVGGD